MSGVTATVCRSCPAGQAGLACDLRIAVAEAGLACVVRETDCMSGCTHPSTVAFRATGKTTYLFGELTVEDIPELVAFLELYTEAPDGNFADARPLGSLREKAIARIPG
ncbi:hypothetical protein DEA8626_02859 [Defluviimonas aquaemixtae]|uniref:Metal-binding protein n=1 Tax=Albidovulum aquaemixtae TaxID=1542388 RepID=A0A2R8BK66_9RHOB|nr:DUF1636 family protein [Defluviimonas aquaemixtae]SPH23789.1 hypothetical protein DEA8626_02859 [Defluviimonas aquaemixtae]